MLKFVREPLFHFLLLGALIFLGYFWLNPPGKAAANEIVVSQNDMDRLVQIFRKQWQRDPTQQELAGLVRAQLKEEVLYREALAMGLDKDDSIVRRRLAQKVEFLITDVIDPGAVDDKTLMGFYQKNVARYPRPARLSFGQIYFSPDLRGERVLDEARATLQTLQTTHANVDVPEDYGDRLMLPPHYDQVSTDDVARDFGRDFADKLAALPPGSWQGPIQSGFGQHLVYIQQREAPGARPFEEVREQVRNDYLFDLRQARSEEVLDTLKSRYKITIASSPGETK